MTESKQIAQFFARIILSYNSEVMRLGHKDGEIGRIESELITKLDLLAIAVNALPHSSTDILNIRPRQH